MKRHRNLFDSLVSFENLLHAARKAQRGKRFVPEVAAFNHHLEGELLRLSRELGDGTYRPGLGRQFAIYDPKPRLITAAPYRDRVVHHAVCNIIEPIFDRTFISDSYACRAGKGTHAAVNRATRALRHNRYVLQCDIHQYFPSIDHKVLKALLRRKLACPRTLAMLNRIIDAADLGPLAYQPGEGLFAPFETPRGLPIGNQTSQFFANVYLNPLDHFVKETLGVCDYVRYCDDFLLFADDKATLWAWRDAIRVFLTERLRLSLHPVRQWVRPAAAGADFLGYRVFPTHRRLLRVSGYRFQRGLRVLQRAYRRGALDTGDVRQRIAAWIGHARHADTHGLRAALLGKVAFRRASRREAVCCAAGAGTMTIQTTSAAPTATGTIPRTGTTTSGFGVCSPRQVPPSLVDMPESRSLW